jgi:hypothetical protein
MFTLSLWKFPCRRRQHSQSSQVMDTIGHLVSALNRDKIMRQPAKGTGCSLKDFCSHHSESFDWKGNHIQC